MYKVKVMLNVYKFIRFFYFFIFIDEQVLGFWIFFCEDCYYKLNVVF